GPRRVCRHPLAFRREVLAACQPSEREASADSGKSPWARETVVKELRDAAILVIDRNCVTFPA
ncbi:MAG TPA: hypothetical protein VGL02_11130, partial [Streptomyces sp.]